VLRHRVAVLHCQVSRPWLPWADRGVRGTDPIAVPGCRLNRIVTRLPSCGGTEIQRSDAGPARGHRIGGRRTPSCGGWSCGWLPRTSSLGLPRHPRHSRQARLPHSATTWQHPGSHHPVPNYANQQRSVAAVGDQLVRDDQSVRLSSCASPPGRNHHVRLRPDLLRLGGRVVDSVHAGTQVDNS
jgi:hypothetical protein